MQGERISSVSFAGAGNVAGYLAPALMHAGFKIVSIFSRNAEKAGELASLTGAKPVWLVDDIVDQADLLILALPDEVIPGFSMSLKNAGKFNGIVAHTSGSQSLGSITRYHAQGGVFYPLQSFTRFSSPDISKVPFCIEGATPEIAEKLVEVAECLSGDVRLIDTPQRAQIHLAAVFACNFTNYLYSVADCLLAESGVQPDILMPLIRETALRISGGDAAVMQTGPAVRKDWSTIDMHLNMLRNHPEWKEIYKTISELIVKLKEPGSTC
ncbi:MAG: Rossmann-like and DUF2520 domain-containing protein [Lentimicrobium sp.]